MYLMYSGSGGQADRCPGTGAAVNSRRTPAPSVNARRTAAPSVNARRTAAPSSEFGTQFENLG
jgi:hypothetical protein